MNNWSITGTRNTVNFLEFGSKILNNNGSAIDAVEEVIKLVEDNPDDWSVGYNGFPNLLGEVELDASIMIGSSMLAGAVAGIKKFKHPISIARKVMELTPHILLVGEGAEQFARNIGFMKIDSLCDDSMVKYYQNIINGEDLLDGLQVPQKIQELAWRYDKYLKRQLKRFDYKKWYLQLSDKYHGTVNVIAKDQSGEICSGVSTSGLALKFPGRAGDSPLIGAGNFCDKRYGAAACVGTGELAIRLGIARQTVNYLKDNSVQNAVELSIKDIFDLNTDGVIQVLAMDSNGNVSACSNTELHYILSTSENPEVRRVETTIVKK